MREWKIFCLILFVIILFGIFADTSNNKISTSPQKPVSSSQEQTVQDIKPKEIKRLSIEEQDNDKKGIVFPANDRLKITINDISIEELYYHPKFDIEAYYVNLNKYPQISTDVLKFSEYLVNYLCENSPVSPIDIDAYIFSSPIDFYYLREFPQTTPKQIILELEKQRPILHITYHPDILLSVCVLAPEGYKLLGKTKYNGWVWEPGGLNACGYEYTKKIAAY